MAGLEQEKKMVFGLDIGTRSIVGTVGYKDGDRFVVVAQKIKEHETRAMMDGQIHDIKKVSSTITAVKEELEAESGEALKEVCIAAAGRVLHTVTTNVTYEFFGEKVVAEEDICTLSAMGVEQAFEQFQQDNNTDVKFYCVGYSIIRYYVNNYPIVTPEDHKAASIGADMIVTFLPEDVVDGLYKAVEMANLTVANLTLEPIAAIQVAIPERFRMLNIALVDVGAGTSDISITKEGSIISYGMIPVAGDSLTEAIANHCLVDFNHAEAMKRQVEEGKDITYTDIMGLEQTISAEEMITVLQPAINKMVTEVAECIRRLNGDKSVSAVFVVGGGGKIPGYTELLAKELNIVNERVALRGKEVLGMVDFPDNADVDSTLVTPIGICMCFYENNNNFIYLTFNDERLKIFDNGKLAVIDAAMQAEYPHDQLFPKRGAELNYTIEGKSRIKRGMLGEAAVITVNDEPADIHTRIRANDVVKVLPPTAGEDAKVEIRDLPEYHQTIVVNINGKSMDLPKFAQVNGELQSGYYEIQNGDAVEMLSYYTVSQILDFMDLMLPESTVIKVNNTVADRDSKVYENFTVDWTVKEISSVEETVETIAQEVPVAEPAAQTVTTASVAEPVSAPAEASPTAQAGVHSISVVVNGQPITLSGKAAYVYVDVFDYIDFDLSKRLGSGIVTTLNGKPAEYLKEINTGDVIEIYWEE